MPDEVGRALSRPRCSLEHGSPAYCFQCGEFPCGRYEGIDEYDSFITHQKRLADMERARAAGLADYQAELRERQELLNYFLANCNDGRRKTLFYLAANLLSLKALQEAREQAGACFAGDRSAEDAAKAIQSRVELYLNEQK